MSRRLALVLRGISYYDDISRKVCNSSTVDYKQCLPSFQNNVLLPLKILFNQIDIFLITYNSQKLSEILTDYNPADVMIYSKRSVYNQNPLEVTANLVTDSINIVERYSNLFNCAYDNIMIVRFDMYYPMKLPIERLRLDRFNFGWKGTYGQCDDCFHFFTPEHIARIRQYIPQHNKDGYLHGLNHAFETESNYLSLKPRSDIESYPDFYFFQRRMREFENKKMQLVEWKPKNSSWVVLPEIPIVNYSGNHVVIITSCINPSDAPLSYSNTRSVFTPEERLKQTIESITSARAYIPCAIIVLINNNFLTNEQHLTLLKYCHYVFIFDSIRLEGITFTADLAKTFPNKNCTEVASLLYSLRRIKELKLDYDYIWKLSGRYKLLNGFDVTKWLNNYITVPPRQPNGSVNNILYAIPNQKTDHYIDILKKCFVACYEDKEGIKGCMVEHTLFESTELIFLNEPARIGGMCSHLPEKKMLCF